MPQVEVGSGSYPIRLVVISAKDLAASTTFYTRVFGWQMHTLSPELTAAVAPAGPGVALRTNLPDGFPGVVPYIGVPDVKEALGRITSAGGAVEREPWTVPTVGKLARFTDPSGTVYGVTEALMPGDSAHVPAPFGTNPRPAAGSLCSLEMYAADHAVAAKFFGDLFGWATKATMPNYLMFDVGAGIGGVFQSHTPVAPAMAYIYAPDVHGTLEQIEAAGGKRMGDAMRVPGLACFGYFTDPSGTAMGLIGE